MNLKRKIKEELNRLEDMDYHNTPDTEKDLSRDEIVEILNEIYELKLEGSKSYHKLLDELFEKIGIGFWSYPSSVKEELNRLYLREQIPVTVKGLMNEQTLSVAPNAPSMLMSYVAFSGSGPSSINSLNQCMPSIRSFLIKLFLKQGPSGNYLFNNVANNPNQPCNYLLGLIDNMQTNLAQAGPNSQSAIMWQCKLDIYNGVLSWVQSHPVIQSVSPPWQC